MKIAAVEMYQARMQAPPLLAVPRLRTTSAPDRSQTMMSAAGQWTWWPFCPSYCITPLLFMYLMYILVLGSVLCINVYLYGN